MDSGVREEGELPPGPEQRVLELSSRKAEEVAARVAEGLVLGADTIVLLDGEILGKPADGTEAKRMLSRLSGRMHQVLTGLTLIDVATGTELSELERTKVKIRTLSAQEIEDYVRTGEPLDKAGAYGIQGQGAALVEGIEGCFYNVVGLPLAKLAKLLTKLGLSWPFYG